MFRFFLSLGLGLGWCQCGVQGLRVPDPLFGDPLLPECPKPYVIKVNYGIANLPNGPTWASTSETLVHVEGTGNLVLPGITFGTGAGEFNLNAATSFVNPLTGTLIPYSSLPTSSWPNLNMPFQTESTHANSAYPSVTLQGLYNHYNGIPAVEWENAGSFALTGFSGRTCWYLGKIQTVPLTTITSLHVELFHEMFTLTGEGIFNATFHPIYRNNLATGALDVSSHLGFATGMHQLRTSAAILISYDPVNQVIRQAAPGLEHATQNSERPLVHCMNDWSGPNCDPPLVFDKDTRISNTSVRCNNYLPPFLNPTLQNVNIDSIIVDTLNVGCVYNYTPYAQQGAQMHTDLGQLPAALFSLKSSCAALVYRKNHQDRLWQDIFPFFFSEDSGFYQDDHFNPGALRYPSLRGVVDMVQVSDNVVATHICTRLITEGRVQELAPNAYFIASAFAGSTNPAFIGTSIRGTYCTAREDRCICNAGNGGAQCQYHKRDYCHHFIPNDYYDLAAKPDFFVPNPFDPSDAYVGDPRFRYTQPGSPFSQFVRLDFSAHNEVFGIPTSSSFSEGQETQMILDALLPGMDDLTGQMIPFSNVDVYSDTSTHRFYFQPPLTTSFVFPIGYPNTLDKNVLLEDDAQQPIQKLANRSSLICAGKPESCQWDLDGATNVARQFSPDPNHIGCLECGYSPPSTAYHGRFCDITCSPACGPNFVCANSGGNNWPLFPGAMDLHCVCAPGYVDALPSTSGTPEKCVTCINEVGADTPTCNGHGTCLLGSWTGPPTPLVCTCDSNYIDQSCTLLRTRTVVCGAQSIAFNCTFQAKGALSVVDYRYVCQATATLWTGTVPNESYPASFFCPNVPSTLTCSEIHTACLKPTQDTEATVTTDICPLPFQSFAGIGQSATAFCDPPVSFQYLKITIYNQHAFCYLHTRIAPGVGLYPYVGKYRCLPSTISSPAALATFGACDILVDYTHVYDWPTSTLGRLVLAQCT